MIATAVLWIWRIANTALLAAGVFILWRHTSELTALHVTLQSLVDYLGVIAERLN